MSDKTFTERLRELLDEHGVEYEEVEHPNPRAHGIKWWALGLPFCYDFYDGHPSLFTMTSHLFPEQAVEATLGPDPREHGLIPHFWTGDETLHIDLGKLPERIDVTLPDPRGREVYSARVHRFEPERGECHNASYRLDESRFHCSECGFGCWVKDVADGHDKLPRYCPNCGAKVVVE